MLAYVPKDMHANMVAPSWEYSEELPSNMRRSDKRDPDVETSRPGGHAVPWSTMSVLANPYWVHFYLRFCTESGIYIVIFCTESGIYIVIFFLRRVIRRMDSVFVGLTKDPPTCSHLYL